MAGLPATNGPLFSKVVPRVRHTMEDFTRWTEDDVKQWVTEESTGVGVLEKEIEKNLYAFNEYNGAKLNMLDAEDMLYLGVSFRSRDIIIKCLDELRANEAILKSRRRKAEKLKQAFLKADEDGDGVIDQEELRKIVQQTYPDISDHLASVYYNIVLSYCDPEETGRINVPQLLKADHETMMMHIMTEAEKAEEVERVFNEIDVDNSGELDKEELKALIDMCYPNDGPTVRRKSFNKIVQECDKNNDGTISLSEIFHSSYVRLLLRNPNNSNTNFNLTNTSYSAVTSTPMTPSNLSISIVTPVPTSPRSPSPTSPRSGTPYGDRPSSRGVDLRCKSRSPRLIKQESNTGAPVVRSPRIEKLEKDDFKPQGVTGGELVDKAEGILNDKINSHNQWQEAMEFFVDGAEKFIEEDRMEKAGNAYERAGDCCHKLSRVIEAGDMERLAASCYKYVNRSKAIGCLQEAAEIYFDHKRDRLGAKMWADISALYEQSGDLENAVDWLLKVVDYYHQLTDSKTKYHSMLKIANLYCKLEMFSEAADTCLEIANFVKTLNAKEGCSSGIHPQHSQHAMFMCVLCLAADMDYSTDKRKNKTLAEVRKRYEEFETEEYEFSPDYDFLNVVKKACEERNAEAVEQAFDTWKFRTSGSAKNDAWIEDLVTTIVGGKLGGFR